MDKRTVICLVIAIGLLMALVVTLGGGVSAGVVRRVEEETSEVAEASRQADIARTGILDALAAEKELFAARSFDTLWPKRLEDVRSKLDDASAALKRASALCEENDPEKVPQIEAAVADARQARSLATEWAREMLDTANRWLGFKRDFEKNVQDMGELYKRLSSVSLTEPRALIDKSGVDWPEKKEELAARLQSVEETLDRAAKYWEETAELRAGKASELAPEDFSRLVSVRNALETDVQNVVSSIQNIPKWVDQLYWAWDRIFVDAEIEEGAEVRFYFKHRTIRTHVANSAVAAAPEEDAEKAEVKESEQRSEVTRSKYEAESSNLGMVVEHKAAGLFDREVEKRVEPPGYAYMCPPSENRNRYGYWNRSGGSSFWVFYGRYALMRDLFWGRSYYGRGFVTGTHYGDYRSSRRLGRTYYGRDPSGKAQFGKNGSFTRTRFSDSKYVKSGGFRNSSYMKSGGTFRGSRYTKPSRSSSSTSRSSRSYSSSRRTSSRSRFGGGK